MKPFAIYYEHPDWFRPLFAALDKRSIPYERLNATCSMYNPGCSDVNPPYSLVFNRMSPSAYLRGAGNSILYTQSYLASLEKQGLRVINGSKAYHFEINKGLQLQMLQSLGLRYPQSRVINHPGLAAAAARDLRFPVVVKANIGGSGAGIIRYDSMEQLESDADAGTIGMGMDATALVQEYVPARGSFVTRCETLGGRFLYAINVYTTGESFNLCPADICQTTGGVELTRNACPVDAPRSGLKVEKYTPPAEVIEAVESIAQAGNIDVGGIEYMVDDRDGTQLYYDINCLSNFVADAVNVIGFDPHAKLVDFLLAEARD